MPRSTPEAAESDAEDAPKARADKRARILDAAITVFARSGYHGARVSDIAQEAGIAYGLVYHYFKNKEEILATIFEEQWSGLLEALDDVARSPGTLEDKLVSIAALILNAYRVRPDWVKVLVLEIQRSSRFAQPGQVRAVARLFEGFTALLEQGKERGEVRKDIDPIVAATLFIGALDLMITSLVLEVRKLEGDEAAQRDFFMRVARQVVEIFLRGAGENGRSDPK